MIHNGLGPGQADCRRLGWWAVLAPHGWRPAAPDEPGAVEDLNRLISRAAWNAGALRYEVDPGDTPAADHGLRGFVPDGREAG